MKAFQQVRMTFWAIMVFCAFVMVSASCSKKDVVQDEPGFSATEDAGAAAEGDAVPSEEGGDLGAGGVGTPAKEFAAIFFAYDSYALDSAARESLKKNADWMKSNTTATIQIEGHCDERGTVEYNLALGERRSNAALSYLEKIGVEKFRMSVISYGEERPVDLGHDESAWSKNRRAEFIILSK